MRKIEVVVFAACLLAAGCEKEIPSAEEPVPENPVYISLEDVTRLLSRAGIGTAQAQEVFNAAEASATNGYDNEYLMRDIFASPGAGIGDDDATKASSFYERPLRDLLREAALSTKAEDGFGEAFLDSLSNSDIQIYWPYQEKWNGKDLPIVTYDPGGADSVNVGFLPNGEKVLVDEVMASERPVWVVSRNSDAGFTSLEMLRRQDPSWGQGGNGEIIVTPRTKADNSGIRSLILRSFRAKRQWDSWFAGASEFFVKAGSVKNMNFSKDSELLNYRPEVTDFMIVVRRSQKGENLPFNAVMVSDWDKSLSMIGFMITEDDGGTLTDWKCQLTGKYNSRSYGIELSIPINSRDDIVWRGSLSRKYVEKYSGEDASFGDVDLVLELI